MPGNYEIGGGEIYLYYFSSVVPPIRLPHIERVRRGADGADTPNGFV
jgi:hypothetical protein